MTDQIFISFLIDSMEFMFAAVSVWVVLRVLDALGEIRFRDMFTKMEENGTIHIYLAARFLGACLLGASIYG